jgi:hypothetical protein
MKKLFLVCIIALIVSFAGSAIAADVTLQIKVPSAWVPATVAAITDMYPIPPEWRTGQPQGVRVKTWTEYQIRAWLRNIVAPYRTKLDKEAALAASEYVPTVADDIPITISDETPPE